ncbi:MAG: hypothetical protein AAFR67_02675, partial [Chloroflexota bacterium]
GKVRKMHNTRATVHFGGGDDGAGGSWFDTANEYSIQVETLDKRSRSFYVTSAQFYTIPSRIDITLYYDPVDEQILSVEPPYHASNQELGE